MPLLLTDCNGAKKALSKHVYVFFIHTSPPEPPLALHIFNLNLTSSPDWGRSFHHKPLNT